MFENSKVEWKYMDVVGYTYKASTALDKQTDINQCLYV